MKTHRHRSLRPTRVLGLGIAAALLGAALATAAEETPSPTGTVEFAITERGKEQPVPCRVHLSDAAGKPVKVAGFPFWKDHFVCDGRASVKVPPGRCSYVVERGPEYRPVKGELDVTADESKPVRVTIERIVDMAHEGWWSGDLHIHRPVKDIELLAEAEDLHEAPVITWWYGGHWKDITPPGEKQRVFDGTRVAYVRGGEDERDGGALLFFYLNEPLPLKDASEAFPPMTASITEARRHPGVWIDIEKPFWWDLPLWLATGQIDSIGLANNHMNRSRMLDEEAWGRPRDVKKYPPINGNGLYSQDLYYQVLNCGLRVPPSAGSASGVLPNPVGYNRVYVQLDKGFDDEAWWKGLKAGRSFVTNGPLLRCRVNGNLPGHVFTAPAGQSLTAKIEVELDSNDPVSNIELIRNGQIVLTHKWDPAQRRGTIGPISFDASGWFLIRAIADVPHTFRFASTAPFYVQIGDRPFISRASVQFFLDWIEGRSKRTDLKDPAVQAETLKYCEQATAYWRQKLDAATAP